MAVEMRCRHNYGYLRFSFYLPETSGEGCNFTIHQKLPAFFVYSTYDAPKFVHKLCLVGGGECGGGDGYNNNTLCDTVL